MSYEDDVFIRQQIYLEGVKNNEAQYGDEVTEVIIGIILAQLAKQGVTVLGELKKSEFQLLLTTIVRLLKGKLRTTRGYTVARLRSIARFDYALTKQLHMAVFAEAAPPSPPVVKGGALWADIRNTPVAATGDKPLVMVDGFYTSAIASAAALIKQAYADRWTVTDLVKKLTGTKANKFKDGLMSKIARNYGSMIETTIQHVSAFVSAKLGAFFSKRYVWISVLDANTTDVCRGRNGNIYEYGKGPQPPAHYRCRSRTRAIFAESTVPATFYGWLTGQPPIVVQDIFGTTFARRLRTGDIRADDVPRYENQLTMTPEEYRNKADLILTR